jgi:hypothetical protein
MLQVLPDFPVIMEAAGIEPASADAPVRASTGLAHAFVFARTAGALALPGGSHPSVSHLRRLALRRRPRSQRARGVDTTVPGWNWLQANQNAGWLTASPPLSSTARRPSPSSSSWTPASLTCFPARRAARADAAGKASGIPSGAITPATCSCTGSRRVDVADREDRAVVVSTLERIQRVLVSNSAVPGDEHRDKPRRHVPHASSSRRS